MWQSRSSRDLSDAKSNKIDPGLVSCTKFCHLLTHCSFCMCREMKAGLVPC